MRRFDYYRTNRNKCKWYKLHTDRWTRFAVMVISFRRLAMRISHTLPTIRMQIVFRHIEKRTRVKKWSFNKNIHSDDLFGRSLFKFRLNAKCHKIQDGKSRGEATMQLSRPFYHWQHTGFLFSSLYRFCEWIHLRNASRCRVSAQ